MSKKIGLSAKAEKGNSMNLGEEGKCLQAQVEKLLREKKKVLDENKVLKKELEMLKKEASRAEQETVEQLENKQ